MYFVLEQKKSQTLHFKCQDHKWTSQIPTRDQIIIGTSSDKIREEVLKQSWKLEHLKREDMKVQSALHGVAELFVEAQLNKLGQYSKWYVNQKNTSKSKACYFCGFMVNSSITEHVNSCKAKKYKCINCKKMGHYEWDYRNKKVCELELDDLEQKIQQIHTHNDYNADIFKIDFLKVNVSNTPTSNLKDFKAQVIINNHLGTVLVDTGAKVSM